ncbi:MAG: hypothetical protein SPH79_07750 [Schaalia hyovaginalis]|uniref:DUF6912 family protein n=1 Tax=Schaalia hyovaginalis TaxID=29316 RepID=UPI001F19964A|nr:hypothetical protein [Schaalia hyovaginalis]MCF2710666.1 hypothetical protein [Schaalia hyovaginalis]MDY6214367.1 hypothetical protein [Schaalia hyovaginalis]
MRVYLPLLPSELLDDSPRPRSGFTVVAPADCDREGVEVLEDDAQTEAALLALSLMREEEDEEPLRMVVAQDVDAPQPKGEGVVEAGDFAIVWDAVAAILSDDPEAAPTVRRVLDAEEQDEADAAVADLWEFSLGWYDVSERESMARFIARSLS